LKNTNLDDTHFTGKIPATDGQIFKLTCLLLNRNSIGGPVPVFENTSRLEAFLVDGTNVTGDLASICAAFSSDRCIAVADCADTDSAITCGCCQCCPKGGCSDPLVANLDWTWENESQRGDDQDNLISMGLLRDPED
jgi:hypothetical protein